MTKTQLLTTISNTCDCDHEHGCGGSCWDDVVECFAIDTAHLFDKSEYGWWRVSDLPVWDGTMSGISQAKNAVELLRLMTVRGEWILRYRVTATKIVALLSHHDCPTGGTLTVRPLKGDR